MPQPTGFWTVHSLGRVLFCKYLKFCVFIYSEIQLPVTTLCPVIFSNYFKAQFFNVKLSRLFNVRNNNGDMVY